MGHDAIPLPEFASPPVVEVALSVQFAQLPLKCVHLGLLWREFKEDFPTFEELPPLPGVVERFGSPTQMPGHVGLRIETSPPVPRCWFLDEDGTRLVQIQRDRFTYNWRKSERDEEYPRYGSIAAPFKSEFGRFCELVKREGMGEVVPNQCEITYVNHILASEGWERFGELGNVLTVWETGYSDGFLGEPEQARFNAQFVIPGVQSGAGGAGRKLPGDEGDPIGRLHVAVEPRYRTADRTPLLQLSLTARGRPTGEEADGVLGFMDIGHRWIVRGFTSITTSRMHEIWGRKK